MSGRSKGPRTFAAQPHRALGVEVGVCSVEFEVVRSTMEELSIPRDEVLKSSEQHQQAISLAARRLR